MSTSHILLMALLLQTSFCLYYTLRRYRKFNQRREKRANENRIRGDRNAGNQWKGENMTYNACNHKELTECERFLFDTIKDQRAAIERLVLEKQGLRQELESIRNEHITLKIEQVSNRIPLIDMNRYINIK